MAEAARKGRETAPFAIACCALLMPGAGTQEPSVTEGAVRLGMEHVARGTVEDTSDPRIVLDNAAEVRAMTARERRIQSELGRLDDHEWAGSYYEGDGLGTNVRLQVAPEGGAVYTWTGCMGLYDFNHGEIVDVADGRLHLELAMDPALNHGLLQAGLLRSDMSADWLWFDWGKLRFMVPTIQMVSFCNDVNGGSSEWAEYPHRAMDGSKPVILPFEKRPAGMPAVPAAYRPFLLEQPLSGTLGQAGAPTFLGTLHPERPIHEVRATVDLGREEGLLPGMVLHVIEPGIQLEGQAVSVGNGVSEVAFLYNANDRSGGHPLEKGWAVSTRDPHAINLSEKEDPAGPRAR